MIRLVIVVLLIGVIVLVALSLVPQPITHLSVSNVQTALGRIQQLNELAVYRMALSEREQATFNEGDALLDVIGVCLVEAVVDMEQVEVTEENNVLTVTVPEPVLRAVMDEGFTFVWREHGIQPNNALTQVAETIRLKCLRSARTNGVLDEARQSATTFFTHFLNSLGYEQVRVQFTNN